MPSARMTWHRRIVALAAIALGSALTALLVASVLATGDDARLMLAANGPLPRGAAIAAGVATLAWEAGAWALRPRHPRAAALARVCALVAVGFALALLWRWQHGVATTEAVSPSALREGEASLHDRSPARWNVGIEAG